MYEEQLRSGETFAIFLGQTEISKCFGRIYSGEGGLSKSQTSELMAVRPSVALRPPRSRRRVGSSFKNINIL